MGLQGIFDKLETFSDKTDQSEGIISQDRVARKAEYNAFVRNNFFMTVEERKNFNSSYMGNKLPKFVRYAPKPELDGYYKIGIMGILNNPNAQWKGYLPTSKYFMYQLKLTKDFSFAAFTVTDIDFSLIGIILAILITVGLFLAAVAIRLPIGILLTIIQFFVVIFASKNLSNKSEI
jgi:hypothetical protein